MYTYKPGKQDWLAGGLPTEGHAAGEPRIGRLARPVPTCRLDERIADVRPRLDPSTLRTCVVVDEHRVVLGRLRGSDVDRAAGDARAQDVMRPGPSTFRPHVPVPEMVEYMERNDLRTALVTDSEGRLIGLFVRERDNAEAG